MTEQSQAKTQWQKPQIQRLTLDNFRNHTNLSLDFDHSCVIFCGDNGSGKTNILEALSFLSPGRGMRRVNYDKIACQSGPDHWTLSTLLHKKNGTDCHDVTIGTGFMPGQAGRIIRIDQMPVQSSEDLLNHVQIIWLTPSMDGLFTGANSDRRRFFDRCVLALHPDHGKNVKAFEQLMRERNKVLQDHPSQKDWLSSIEAQMAYYAAMIMCARLTHCIALNHLYDQNSDKMIILPHAALSIMLPDAESSAMCSSISLPTQSDWQSHWQHCFESNRFLDQKSGRCLKGPHRFDLIIMDKHKNIAAALASTGEQKALLTGLVLTQAHCVAQNCHLAPIMLMDEFSAHLDHHKRSLLLEWLNEIAAQIFMTGTDKTLFEQLCPDANLIMMGELVHD
jgi:DNA replication and repair protein RecF